MIGYILIAISVVLAFLSAITSSSRWYWWMIAASIAMMLLAVTMTMTAPAAAATGTYTRDGDTVVLNSIPIRLKGLSCAELKTPLGQSQKLVMITLMNSATKIEYELTGEKTFDRQVGYIYFDGVDAGLTMIQTSGCQPCRRYDKDGRYAHLPVTGSVPKYCNKR